MTRITNKFKVFCASILGLIFTADVKSQATTNYLASESQSIPDSNQVDQNNDDEACQSEDEDGDQDRDEDEDDDDVCVLLPADDSNSVIGSAKPSTSLGSQPELTSSSTAKAAAVAGGR